MAADTVRVHEGNPAVALARAFSHIAATRMAGLPVCNPALTVAVVGMAEHEGEWLGGLVTPWALSLIMLPGPGGRFRPIDVGESQSWTFPSGSYEFLGSTEPGLGHYQSCSLFSPVFEFADQDTAEEVVGAARQGLFELVDGSAAVARAEAARLAGAPLATQALSRREFLRGGLFGRRG